METDNDFKNLKDSFKDIEKAEADSPKTPSTDNNGRKMTPLEAKAREEAFASWQACENFREFYEKAVWELADSEESRVKYKDSWGDKLQMDQMATVQNKLYQKRRKALWPKVHQYFRENGIPNYLLIFETASNTYDMDLHEGVLDPGASKIRFPFHLLAADFPTGTGPTARYKFNKEVLEDRNGKKVPVAFLCTRLSNYRYTPEGPYDGCYSPKYKELEDTRKELETAYDRLQEDVDSAKHDLELFSGFLPLGMLFVLPKLIFLAILTAFSYFWSFLVLLGVEFVLQILLGRGSLFNIVGGIALLLFAVVFCFFMVLQSAESDINPFGCFVDFAMRMNARRELVQAKAALARNSGKAKAELDAFVESEEYLRAWEEEKRLYREDRELAERWQTQWRQQMDEDFRPGWVID